MKDENAQKWADRFVCGLCCFVLLEALVLLVADVARLFCRQ